MANIDHERKRITAVLLFFGPPGAGKTTALYALARHLPPGTHGKVAPLQPGDDRLLRLDYRPHDSEMVYGYQLSFRLVTCPGAVEVDLVRPVLQAADAVMFVADSASNSLNGNIKALELLDKLARSAGRRLDSMPMVFMYNKRDLRDALEIRLLESRLNTAGSNYLAASAIRGQGVLEALQRLSASVAVQLRTELQAEPGVQGNTAATVAHGTTFQQARALREDSPDLDDVTAVSVDAGGPALTTGWDVGPEDGNDDKTEVNPMGGGWDVDGNPEPRPPVPPRASSSGHRAAPQRQPPSKRETAPRRTPGGHGMTGRSPPVADPGDLTDVSAYEAAPAPSPRRARAPEPVYGNDGAWRTPDQFADIDSDDHTAPYMDFDEEVAAVPGQPDRIDSASDRRGGPASATAGRRPSTARASQPARPVVSAPVRPEPPPAASYRGPDTAARARRVEPPPRQAPPPVVIATAPPLRAAAARPVSEVADGDNPFTKTMAINALGREAEAWEAGIDSVGHTVRVRVPDLAGYVVSRIGTPRAASRRTVRIPIRATHMDTLVPQDFLVDLEFRGAGLPGAPVVTARRTSTSSRSVPLGWVLGGLGAVTIVVVILWLAFVANG